MLWKLQNSFYDGFGSNAWCDAMVPNFVTSNGYIAKVYAIIEKYRPQDPTIITYKIITR